MKKSFRNRILAFAAISVSSFLLLSGFDSALTLDDVMNKSQEANANLNEFIADVQGTADITLDVVSDGATTSLPMSGGFDMDIQYSLSPIMIGMTGTFSGQAGAMGMAGELGMEMYIVEQDDGTGMTYVKMTGLGEDAEGWDAGRIPADLMAQVTEAVEKARSGDIASISEASGIDVEAMTQEFLEGAELAPEAVNVNGKDCYEITQTITGDKLYDLFSQVVAANPQMAEAGMDESTLQIVQMVMSMIQVDFTEDVDVETFLPAYASFDLSNSDFSMIAQMAGSMMFQSDDEESAPEISLSVNALNMTMNYDYETPVSIEVPEEALSAEVSDIDLDAVEELADTAA